MHFLDSSLEETQGREWIVTNGIGSYASSSVCGMNTRRYHGLLVCSANPPTARSVVVSKVEETIFKGDEVFYLSTNQYPGTTFPEGYKHLVSFERDPFPRFYFKFNGSGMQKEVMMPYGVNASILTYTNTSKSAYVLKVNPLLVHRDYHALFREDAYFDFFVEDNRGVQTVYPHYGASPLYMKVSAGKFVEELQWFRSLEYAKETFRGQDDHEDAHCPGYFEVEMKPGDKVFLTFSMTKTVLSKKPEKLIEEELLRQTQLAGGYKNDFVADLVKSADQFMVKRQSTKSFTLLAGYHWFTDWGRDTMISMLGLCFSLDRKEEAKSIFQTFLKYLDGGMLPNRFPDYEGEVPEYNTVDATLWLFVALYEYYQRYKDDRFLNTAFPKLEKVLDRHIEGTRYNIKVDDTYGLLHSGNPGVQLTWMDAKVGDYVVTPRNGFAVEINALWYNALKIHAFFAEELQRDNAKSYDGHIQKMEEHFPKFFWNEKGYLNDIIYNKHEFDDSIRPNQVYVVSLPFSLLDEAREKKVVNTVKEHLLTDYGLRTLDQNHADFRWEYKGDQYQRDTAYHQGTVWPFMLADYCQAYMKVYGKGKKAKSAMRDMIAPLKEHFYHDACIHGISEIFDGANPEHGKGCIHQAWSVSALLRILEMTGDLHG